ncbi:MAG TPA: TIGR03619 family F420-dependent LLM class oxidoreductase [Mycobacteriales bacterium]|nr:TIGR03619 family F420-dependent LLM class oxidoreductase [Mycobacteriales bacterium]
MRLQVVLPNESTRVEPGQIIQLAQQAEALGYHAVWLPDHLLPPGEYGATYGGVYEPLILLTAIAAVTERIELGTSVLILPLRHPVLVAKQVTTLERLAPGRVVLGVGIGWDRTEFGNLGSDFRSRAARTDESLDLIRHLVAHGHGPFEGEHYGFQQGIFAPLPESHIAIMVGGVSDAALRRAAARADLWQAFGLTPQQFAERAHHLRTHGGEAVRPGSRIEWTSAERDVDEIVAELEEFRDAGAEHLAVHFGSVDGFADRMGRLADAWSAVES